MPENESPREFPKPPRKFSGQYLDPLLIEEDYDEVVGITRRYAERTPGFTDEELIAYLALKNGVRLYGTQGDWEALFAETRERIVAEATEARPPVHISWTVGKLGEQAIYTMVEVPPAIPAPADPVPVVAQEVLKTAAATLLDEAVHPDQPTFDYLLLMLGGTGEGVMFAREARDAVARRFRVNLEEAGRRIQSAVSAGVVRNGSRRGIKIVGLPSDDAAEAIPAEQEEPEDEVAHVEVLAELDAYFAVIKYVMSALSSLRDINMGQPYDRLWKRSSLEELMDFDGFKRYVRRMEVDGLVRIEKNAKLSTKTARSQIIRGSKVFAASVEIKASWKVNGRENWKALYEAALQRLLDEHAG